MADAGERGRDLGLLGFIGVAVGVGCLLVAVLGAVNTAFELGWALEVSGAETPLPTNYEVCIGLAAVAILLIVFSLFGSFVVHAFKDAKGMPLARVGIVVGSLGLVAVAGRGIQILALVSSYGSMLAYYCTDGDLDDVRAELAKNPSREDLDQAVGRAAQYDNHEALALLLDAGADLRDETTEAEFRHCALASTGPEFIAVALEHGVTPEACPNAEFVIWSQVSSGQGDAEIAERVAPLMAAGFSTTGIPEYGDRTALELAEANGLTQTVAVLRGSRE